MTEISKFNPYAPPAAAPGERGEPNEVAKVRYELLATETRFLGLGTGYFLVCLFISLFGAFALSLESPEFGLPLLAAAVLLLWLAIHLFRLDPGRRRLYLLGGLGLLVFPLGTFLGAWLYYLLGSAKGRRVLAPEYRRVIEATPHIRYRSPWLLGIVILALALLLPVLIVYRYG